MDFLFDPRGDLPPPDIEPSSYYPAHRRAISHTIPVKKPKKKQCHDWIFSTASNVHVAIDRVAFKTYANFKSYVLTVADQRQVPVRGIGTVELKLRRAPGGGETHTLVLENVLHVPDWLCNVFSDSYFIPAANFEHTWTEFGVNLFEREKGTFRTWGYTENFCGLDRLVLSKNLQGRSPMLEDLDREVFSVSLTWPQSQKDKWHHFTAREMKQEAERIERTLKTEQAEDDAKGSAPEAKRHVKDHAKWRLMPTTTTVTDNLSKSDVAKIRGELQVLPRGSSRVFDGAQA